MDGLGAKISYLALADRMPVYHDDGTQVGAVERVVADEGQDIFHGVVVRTPPPDRRELFASRDDIRELRERGVVLAVPSADLPDAAADAPARTTAAEEGTGPGGSLRRVGRWLGRG
ncbi:PRC-barrel domain-containing protein [Micromonospora sp. WMMD812]|uniref:PRC-barrel domain-containing protein n=1 Tax=Micromonospora sp. WMMD812 TaxID=3015152 RepID=UPI00248C7D7E|nr:PRC-barrel domain-containing protein [Micromonospora sp. WMMD812]WBB68951.1 PRC-barrel domain-containing protein [Micromonospora sp. WMMD812]